jgi:hypothetical protein
MFSNFFPNRTKPYGDCCDARDYDRLTDLLDHDKVLAFFTNQHNNFTHPKLVSLPRGMNLFGDNKKILRDSMRRALAYNQKSLDENQKRKNKLVFSATSDWRFRPQLMNCVGKKFEKEDFEGLIMKPNRPRLPLGDYFDRIASARIGLPLPGMGYDSFRFSSFH